MKEQYSLTEAQNMDIATLFFRVVWSELEKFRSKGVDADSTEVETMNSARVEEIEDDKSVSEAADSILSTIFGETSPVKKKRPREIIVETSCYRIFQRFACI